MAFRFRKILKIAPGFRINLSKSGASLSLGGKGVTANISPRGIKHTFSIPGTGISYSTPILKHAPTPHKKSGLFGWSFNSTKHSNQHQQMEDASLQVNLGTVGSRSGELKFSFIVQSAGNARMQIYAYDPSDMRKSGVILTLQKEQYEHLKNIIRKSDELIDQMQTRGQAFEHARQEYTANTNLIEGPRPLQMQEEPRSSAIPTLIGSCFVIALVLVGWFLWGTFTEPVRFTAMITPPPTAAPATVTPELVFPQSVVASRDIKVTLKYGLATIRKGQTFTLLSESPMGFSAEQGALRFSVTREDFIKK